MRSSYRTAMVQIICIALLLARTAGISAAPTTAPAVIPTAAPATQTVIEQDLKDLGDLDPAVRDAARTKLMGLGATDLPELRQAVQRARPLQPGQVDALREIVEQVYLSGQNSNGEPEQGFMGVKMRTDFDSVMAGDDNDADRPLGVVVDARIPGFGAYRMLQDGDVILSISTPGVGETRVHSGPDISQRVGTLSRGQIVRLTVLRGGRHVDVQIILDARPHDLAPAPGGQMNITFERFRDELDDKAAQYWKDNFAPLVDSTVS